VLDILLSSEHIDRLFAAAMTGHPSTCGKSFPATTEPDQGTMNRRSGTQATGSLATDLQNVNMGPYLPINGYSRIDRTAELSERWVVCLCNEPMAVQSARHDSRLKFLPIT